MREHFPDDYKGIIASDKTWRELMKILPPHFVIQKDKKVVFLVKGIFPEEITLDQYINYFPEGYKGMTIKSKCIFNQLKDQNSM